MQASATRLEQVSQCPRRLSPVAWVTGERAFGGVARTKARGTIRHMGRIADARPRCDTGLTGCAEPAAAPRPKARR